MSDTYFYKAFGLIIASELKVPEFINADRNNAVDVTIRLGLVPKTLDGGKRKGVCFETAPGKFLFFLEEVGRFLAVDGKRIIYEAADGANEDDLRVFLLGSVIGALLQQRGLFPIHASAVEHNGAAIAFMGPSVIGKSTTAAAFLQKGYRMLTDDVCAIQLVDGKPFVVPGYPQGKLWLDSMASLEMEPELYRPIRNKVTKRAVPMRERFCDELRPLKRIYQLMVAHEDVYLKEAVAIADAFLPLRRNSYRGQFLEGLAVAGEHFLTIATIANQVPLVRLKRNKDSGIDLTALVEAIEEDLAG